jgi:hypothetical protein
MWFDSPAALADACERDPLVPHMRHAKAGPDSFWGEETYTEAMRFARNGKVSLVAEAQAMVDKLSLDLPDATARQWMPSPAGAYPCVPDFLCGVPDSMRARQPVIDDRAPLRIFVDLTTSSAIPASNIKIRGAAILALTMLACERRATDLYVVAAVGSHEGDTRMTAVRIESRPLEMATACYAMTSASFPRRLCYGLIGNDGIHRPGWAFNKGPCAEQTRDMRACLGCEDQDVYVPALHSNNEPMLADPVAWIKHQARQAGLISA